MPPNQHFGYLPPLGRDIQTINQHLHESMTNNNNNNHNHININMNNNNMNGLINHINTNTNTNINTNINHNHNLYNGISTSPTFANSNQHQFTDSGSSTSSTLLLLGGFLLNSNSSSGLNFLYHNPRLRYYLLKSFEAEDDLEFCPEIPETYEIGTPPKKFNPYTATVFLPKDAFGNLPGSPVAPSQLPRPRTPRIKKPIEIVNPHTKMRVAATNR